MRRLIFGSIMVLFLTCWSVVPSFAEVLFFEDFEHGLSQWTIPGSAVLSTRFAFSGSHSQTFTQVAAGGDARTFIFPVTPGQTYYLHVAYLTLGGGGYIGIDQFNASMNGAGEVWLIGDGGFPSLSIFDFNVNHRDPLDLGVWKAYTQAYTIPADIFFIRIKTEDFSGGLPNNPINAGVFFDNIEWSTSPIPRLTITTISLAAVKFGEFFSQEFKAAGGNSPLTWSVVSGTLPAGVTLSADGLLSGTPPEAGDFTFTIGVTDSEGESAEKEFILKVLVTLPPPDIRVNKVGTTPVPGRVLDHFIVVENVGTTTAADVDVVDFLNPNVSLLSVTPPANADVATLADASLVAWTIASLAPGDTRILSHSTKVIPSTPRGTDIGMQVCTEADLQKLQGCLAAISAAGVLGCAACVPTCFACATLCAAAISGPPIIPCVACLGRCALCWSCDFLASLAARQCFNGSNCKRPPEIVLTPSDPNEKLVVANKFIQPDQLLVYPIHFENIGDVEALDVFVTDVLAPNLDVSTLQILTPGASFNAATRTIRWELIGRNLQPGETGNVLFSIRPLPGLPDGTEIRNTGNIQFEIFETITTNEIVNVIDSTPPTCTMGALPPTTFTPDFPITWSGTDTVGEVDTFTVFVSVNGGSFTPFLEKTHDTLATFHGEDGKTYGFICIATDTAGNVEVKNPVAEVLTQVKAPNLDTTPPVITIAATPETLLQPNNTMAPVVIAGTITDNLSGVDLTSARFSVADEYGLFQLSGSIAVNANGSYSFTIQLPVLVVPVPQGFQQYIITVSVTDNAGNQGSTATGVLVFHE